MDNELLLKQVSEATLNAITPTIEAVTLENKNLNAKVTAMTEELKTVQSQIVDVVKNATIQVKDFDYSKGTAEQYKSALGMVITQGLKNYRNSGNYIKSLEQNAGDNFVNKLALDFATKNLTSTTLQDGGILIQPTYYTEILPYLFEKGLMDVIRRKANVVDMPAGSLNIPKDTQEPTTPAFYAPNTAATLSTIAKFDMLTLYKKDLKYNVIFDNELIDNAGYNTVQYVQRKAQTDISLFRDEQVLYGSGASNTIKGLANQYLTTNDFAITGSTLSTVRADLIKLKSQVDTALRQNIDLSRCVILMPSRTRYFIETLATTDGYISELAQDLMNRNQLVGVEVVTTNLIPTNIGGANTEIILIDCSKVFMGIYKPLTMEFTRNDVYTNNSGVTVQGKDTDQSILRIRESFDLLMSYNAGMCKITGVTY